MPVFPKSLAMEWCFCHIDFMSTAPLCIRDCMLSEILKPFQSHGAVVFKLFFPPATFPSVKMTSLSRRSVVENQAGILY